MNMAVSPLQRWEDEGGANPAPAVTPEPPPGNARVLAQFGAALVAEWHRLPTAVQRALYERAVADDARRDDELAKREFACYLHDHKDHAAAAATASGALDA